MEFSSGRDTSQVYSFSAGRPQKQIFQIAGTGLIEPGSRYEYWVETQIRHIRAYP